MARVLNLRDILELVDNRFDDGSFAQENLVHQVHEFVLHVAFELGNQLDVLVKECLKELLGDIPSVCKELTPQLLNQVRYGLSVIHVTRSETPGQREPSGRTFIIDDQVKFEAIEPVHTGLASLGPLFKDPVRVDAPIVAHCQ